MKSRKITLVLTELVIVILILSIASAASLSVFANASEKTTHSENTRLSALSAQNAAECWKASYGNVEKTIKNLENTIVDFSLDSVSESVIKYNDGDFLVVITTVSDNVYLHPAVIDIYLNSDTDNAFYTVEVYAVSGGEI